MATIAGLDNGGQQPNTPELTQASSNAQQPGDVTLTDAQRLSQAGIQSTPVSPAIGPDTSPDPHQPISRSSTRSNQPQSNPAIGAVASVSNVSLGSNQQVNNTDGTLVTPSTKLK